ncbi:type II toxin-antitoxin system death-on-curing family toxin [Paenibacillus campi]|uniref:type II toxin-antitoxin system death-on-curing family toxin n=1 Tax=Paenibacillus campi TaxID=3106031 RepID=UPI002AFDCB28|nr:type II toxin-antitoxin system death-on-curing family toxin [Paenibacillus sp. SGZ-1009]
MIPLTYEDIIAFHNDMLDQYGGLPGVKDDGRISFLAQQPFQESFGIELYPGLFLKAAVYLVSIARAYAFNDANKRTAAMSCHVFLLYNWYGLSMSERMLELITRRAARGMLSYESTARLLERYALPL